MGRGVGLLVVVLEVVELLGEECDAWECCAVFCGEAYGGFVDGFDFKGSVCDVVLVHAGVVGCHVVGVVHHFL